MSSPDVAATPPEPPSEDLVKLANHYGVATEFWDWRGRRVDASRATLVAVLASLGVAAESSTEIAASLLGTEQALWRRILPVCLVVRHGDSPRFAVHVPHGQPIEVAVALEDGGGRRTLTAEDRWTDPCEIDGKLIGEATIVLPTDLPLGYHELIATTPAGETTAPLVVTPARLEMSSALLERQVWGYLLQLYALRSSRSWGIGDLVDLADFAGWTGRTLGAGFALVNPLHAAEPTAPVSDSPYLPTTRRFPSPLYLRVEAVPEYAYLDATNRRKMTGLRKRSESKHDLVDRDAAWTAKATALRLVHAVPRSIGRQASYAAFLQREGPGLEDFATWCAIATVHGSVTGAWPDELKDLRSDAVAEAKAELVDDVDFFRWLQWVLDDQLASTAEAARAAGMPIGIMHDLAVGVHPDGADTWALADVFATGVTVGAPPDEFNQVGQDWSQPPWDPNRLAAVGYRPWRDMLRTILRHAGGLRIDHVIGLFRLWFVPAGSTAASGTYVRYDHEALVGILALEAYRAGVVVVGEDLGTVQPWVREYLAERGILGTSLLWFERDADGAPKRPEAWRELALATVATHDLPPTTAYLTGEHVELRHRLGLLTRPVEEVRAEAQAGIDDWMALLRRLELVRPDASAAAVIEALHRLLARTPSRLVGIQLVDAVGDLRTQNQPGTFREYPNWRLPLTDSAGEPVRLEDLPTRLARPW